MKSHSNNGRTVVVIAAIICTTLVAFAGIGAFVYVNQQALSQQKELKQQEIKAENERAEADREAANQRASKAAQAERCKANPSGFFC